MRISCPNCSAEYDVPGQALAVGPRLLRCARCGHSFKAALPPAPALPPIQPPVLPPSEAMLGAILGAPAESPARLPPDSQADLPPIRVPEPPARPSGDHPSEDDTVAPRRTPAPPASSGSDRLGLAPGSPPDRFALAAWVVTLALLVAAAYACFIWRADIMAAWPPSQRLFALLGLA